MTSYNDTNSNGVYTTYDDADPRIEYSSNPAWDTGVWPQQNPQPLFGTNHGSPNPGATVTLVFNGTGVMVYGLKAADHGYRNITLVHVFTCPNLDGRDSIRCDGRTGEQGSRKLVYWVDGLTPGIHKIKLENTGNQGQYLNIDYFNVTNTTQTNNKPSTSPLGIILGVVVAAAVLSLLAIGWFLWSRRRKARQQQSGYVSSGKRGKGKGAFTPESTTADLPPEARAVQPFYYSQVDSRSGYASPPWSPPANPVVYHTVPTSEPVMSPGSSVATPLPSEMGATSWTSSLAGEATGESGKTQLRYPIDSKARYSVQNTPDASSSFSRPVPPASVATPLSPIIDDSVPPPKYQF